MAFLPGMTKYKQIYYNNQEATAKQVKPTKIKSRPVASYYLSGKEPEYCRLVNEFTCDLLQKDVTY